MKETLKSIKWMDAVILAMAVWILTDINFDDLTTINVIYLVTFTIWIVLFMVRLAIVYQRVKQNGA